MHHVDEKLRLAFEAFSIGECCGVTEDLYAGEASLRSKEEHD